MAAQNVTDLERIRYWQGQLLASGDLQTQLRVDEELRRLHNRAMHRAYGIAIGLTPALDVHGGTVKLTCGMGYDCAGRALIVEEDRPVPLPAQVTDSMTLVLASDPRTIDGIALTWKPTRNVNPNTEVAITRLIPNAAGAGIDPQFRPVVARPMARPQLATGTTIPGQTAWQSWTVGDIDIGVQVVVDTSAAGYTKAPHYFAEAVPGRPTPDFVPAWFASIADPSPDRFTLRLLLRRLTRQSLDIADPKVQVAAAPALDRTIELSQGNLLLRGDHVARLLPMAERLSLIETLSGETATLDVALNDFTATKPVAFGNFPRVAKVTKMSAAASFIEVTVDTPDSFQEGDVVVKLGAQPENALPAAIASIDNAGTLKFLKAIEGLAGGDRLGIAQSASTVATVAGLDFTVADPSRFSVMDVVVRLGNAVETSAPALVVGKRADGTLSLSAPISGLQHGSALGVARMAGTVQSVTANAGEVTLQVNSVASFRAGDVVAKISQGEWASPPVRVESIKTRQNTLTLSGTIIGLAVRDTIGAADFRVRATVVGVAGKTVTVADATVFPKDSAVARIDDLLHASLPAVVNDSSGGMLTLDGAIESLSPGDVIGLCAFPAVVQAQSILNDGTIVLSDSGVLRALDVVTAKSALALVADAGGSAIRLAGAIPGLAEGDSLSVATVRGVVNVTPGGSAKEVTVDQPSRLRAGDFLADITGWRQAVPGGSGTAFVTAVNGSRITVSAFLDGVLLNDRIGLANVTPPLLQLHLNTMPDIVPGDEVLLVGLDRLRGETRSMFAFVERVFASANLVLLALQGAPGTCAFRPEDISASVLFVRGSALGMIEKQDLFVSWLACGDPDPMPKPCAGVDVPDSPCSQVKE